MPRLMPIRVIGMHAMRVIHREQHGPGQCAAHYIWIPADAFQHRLQKRAVRPLGGNAADFLMVVEHQQAVML